ncbi:MAG: hypothetical protein NE330_22625 [Lentisphaeraceae bacterium]|nr:hypothetical protein [Lentisphaeraceae bacterium]
MIKNILFAALFLFVSSCSMTSSSESGSVIIGKRKYQVINHATVRKYLDKANAVVAWHQMSEDAVIRTTHRGERKEADFYIANLADGLDKLFKGRITIVMIIDEEHAQHDRTKRLLMSLNPRKVKVYISYFKKKKIEEPKDDSYL